MPAPQKLALIPSTPVFSGLWQNCIRYSSARRAWRAAFMLIVLAGSTGAWAQSEKSPGARELVVVPAISKIAPSGPASASPWQAATAYPVGIAEYGFAQVGEDMYVISGYGDPPGGTVQTVQRYNATTNIWTKRANIPVGSLDPAAAHFGGKIYVADGLGGANLIRIYDIATDTWSSGPPRLMVGNSEGAAAGAFNGKVYVVGGDFPPTTTVSVYNIATNTWSTSPTPAPSPFYRGGYTQIGQFLYLIGSGTTGANSTVSMRLDMATNTWSTGPVWTPARTRFALAAAGTKLFAMGGSEPSSNFSAQVDELDTSTWPGGTWVASPDDLPSPRNGYSAGFVSTGRIGGEIWSTGGQTPGGFLNEHLFRFALTSAPYTYTIGAGSIVPGTVNTGNHVDDGSTVVALPFMYTLYDQSFTSVRVGSNGHLTFGTVNDTFDPTCIPVTGATYVIAPYWTDQCTGACTGVSGAGLGIFTSVSGTAPNRIFNIEWRTAYFNSGGGAGVPLNYEVRLYEGQPAFDIIYGTVNTFTPPAARKLSTGVQKTETAGQFTSQGCDATGGTAPPVSSGQLFHYRLPSTPTGFLYSLKDFGGQSNEIYGFRVNETTGALTPLSGFPVATGGSASFNLFSERLRVDGVNQRLYATNDGSNTVSAFAVNPATGALTAMPFSPIALGNGIWGPLEVHPTGSPLFVTGNSGVKSFNITSGTVTEAAGSPFAGISARSSVLSREGNYYYEGGAPGNALFGGYGVNPSTGVLTALAGSPFNAGSDGPTGFATDSQGRFLAASPDLLNAFTTASGIPSAVTGNPFPSGMGDAFSGILHPNERFYLTVSVDSSTFGSYRLAGSGAGTTLTPASGSPFPAPDFHVDLVMNQTGAFLFSGEYGNSLVRSYPVDPNSGVIGSPIASSGSASAPASLAYTNPLMVRTAVSRKTHGSAGVFDVNLPLTGAPGVECRNGSGVGSGDHQIVVAFAAPVTVPSLTASGVFTGGGFAVDANVVTITLNGVANAQTLTLRFDGVTDGVNTGTVSIPIGFLAGDTNASRSVNSTDIGQVKTQSGQAVTGANFRTDVVAGGAVNATDIGVVKTRSGTSLPP